MNLDTDKNIQDDKKEHQYYPFTTLGEPSEARDESFWVSVGLSVCPKLSWMQFITIVSVIESIVFLITLIPGISNDEAFAPH